jgi:hypothetical protein
MIDTDAINELVFRRRVKQLWRCGPRATGELLLELAAVSCRRTWLDSRLEAYATLDPATVDALGATDWRALPLREAVR